MKKGTLFLITIILVLITSIALADTETFKAPKYNGRFSGKTIDEYGNCRDEISYKTNINRKVKKYLSLPISSPSKASEENVELDEKYWTTQKADVKQISGTFSSGQAAINAAISSTKPGFGGMNIFNQQARKKAKIDTLFIFNCGKKTITMAIGHCGNVYGLIRTLDEAALQAAFDEGIRAAQARANREAQQAAAIAAAQQQACQIGSTEDGGMIVVSNY